MTDYYSSEPKMTGVSTTSPPDSLFTPAALRRDGAKSAYEDARNPNLTHKAKRIGMKILGQPEDAPETIHTYSYLKGNTGNVRERVQQYVLSLFPFLQWAPRYNLQWLFGDLIA